MVWRRLGMAGAVLASTITLMVGTASGQTVTPGAFCSPAGATGVTVTGLAMVCSTTAADPNQLRWRQASEVATTTTLATTTTAAAVTTTTAPAATTTTVQATTSTTVVAASTSSTSTTVAQAQPAQAQVPARVALTG